MVRVIAMIWYTCGTQSQGTHHSSHVAPVSNERKDERELSDDDRLAFRGDLSSHSHQCHDDNAPKQVAIIITKLVDRPDFLQTHTNTGGYLDYHRIFNLYSKCIL